MPTMAPGVGGSLLALAGGVAGIGQGISQVGAQQAKMNMDEKMNALAQQRDEAMERLRSQHESERQQTQIEAQKGEQQANFSEEEKLSNIKLSAASRAAMATRTFEAEQNKEKLASEERRTNRSASARENAALIHASASQGSGRGGDKWTVHKVTSAGFDPVSKLPTTHDTQVVQSPNGKTYVQVGGNLIPFDATKNAPAIDPKSLRRAPAEDIQDLVKDPFGTVPAGANAGMPKADAFEQTHGYLPASYLTAIQQQQQQRSSASMSLPAGLVRGIGGPNATSTKVGEYGGSQPEEDGAADNADANEEAGSDSSPAFQSGAMNSYSNTAQ